MHGLLSDLNTTVSLLAIIGVLVVVHEWGHFIVARIFNIRVDEFSLGFGPRLLRVGRLGDTEYNIRWLPLGGYVKIAGMDPDEAPLTEARDKAKALIAGADPNKTEVPLLAENTPDKAEDAAQRERDALDGFYSKPGWQRALVIFAGPLMSFVLGVAILCSQGYIFGLPDYALTNVETVQPHSAASGMGLKSGDKIIAIGSTQIANGDAMVKLIRASNGTPITITVDRAGRQVSLTGTPRMAKDDAGHPVLDDDKKPYYVLGFTHGEHYKHLGVAASVKMGFQATRDVLVDLGGRVRHFGEFVQQTGGIIEIASITNDAAKQGLATLFSEAAMLTISLAFFNLLPIPVLDGGHLLIIGIEGLRKGKQLTTQQRQSMMMAGLAIIATLFVLMTTRGIFRLIEHKLPHLG